MIAQAVRRLPIAASIVACIAAAGACTHPIRPASESRWWTGENMTGRPDEAFDPELAYRWRGASYEELRGYWGTPRWQAYGSRGEPIVGYTEIVRYPEDGRYGLTQTFSFILSSAYGRVVDVRISDANVWDGTPLEYGGFQW